MAFKRVPMHYVMPADALRPALQEKYPDGTTTLAAIGAGDRLATTRTRFADVGDVIEFYAKKGQELQDKYIVTGVAKPDFTTPEGIAAWENAEGWSYPYIQNNPALYKQVTGPRAVQTTFRLATPEELQQLETQAAVAPSPAAVAAAGSASEPSRAPRRVIATPARLTAAADDPARPYRLVVAGGRHFDDVDLFNEAIAHARAQIGDQRTLEIISGMASGADRMGVSYAKENNIPLVEMPAAWHDLSAPGAVVKVNRRGEQYNVNAGFQRNMAMAAAADGVLLMPGGPGTAHMANAAHNRRLEVFDFRNGAIGTSAIGTSAIGTGAPGTPVADVVDVTATSEPRGFAGTDDDYAAMAADAQAIADASAQADPPQAAPPQVEPPQVEPPQAAPPQPAPQAAPQETPPPAVRKLPAKERKGGQLFGLDPWAVGAGASGIGAIALAVLAARQQEQEQQQAQVYYR